MSEKVLVFANSVLDKLGLRPGFNTKLPHDCLEKILNSDQLHFMRRDHAECNENYRQLIPYSLLKFQDKILTYQRTKKSGEVRLRSLRSLGFGGHLNPIDTDSAFGDNVYSAGLCRELDEELVIEDPFTLDTIGFIRDDSNEVGRVHFGVVHTLNLSSEKVGTKDSAIADVRFMGFAELAERQFEFENWSKLIIDEIAKDI